jgi:3-oxoadipate enol-lactonase
MSKRALVLVHGYPFDHSLWDKTLGAFPAGIEIIAPDLPGFGGPSITGRAPSLEFMADHIAALLEQRQIERAVIAGMSMGGYVTLAFAEIYGSKVAGLGLISSQAAADTDEARAGRRSMIEKIRREGPSAAAAAAIPKLFAPANSSRAEFTQFPISAAQRAGTEGLAWALEAMARRPDRTALLESLRIPALVLHGSEDQFIPAQCARALAERLPNARYVEIPGAGHATPLEAPQAVAQAVIDLVDRSFTPSPV